jgi:hypothetical protein
MRWIFIDEQTEKAHLGRFFCFTFVAMSQEQLSSVRDDLITALHPILGKESNVIPRFPVLHGSDFLRGYSDDDKLLALQAVVTVVLQHRLKLGRIGYFEKDFLGEITHVRSMASFSIVDLALKAFDDQIVPIYELDISRHREVATQLNDFQNQYMRFRIGKESLSMPFERVMGVHFADKENHWMQISDVTSYLLWLHSRWSEDANVSEFKAVAILLAENLLPHVVYSEVVQVNNPTFHPVLGPNGFRPLTMSFPVIPSDSDDLASQSKRFKKYLFSVLARRKAGKTPG